MRPGQQKNRMRGRGRKGPNPLSRSYESNGPDVKIRGTAQHIAEKYATLARDASGAGDRVMAENYLQHAEHYNRIVAAAQAQFPQQRDDRDSRDDAGEDDDSQDTSSERGERNEPRRPDGERGGNRDRERNRERRDRTQPNGTGPQPVVARGVGDDESGIVAGERSGVSSREERPADATASEVLGDESSSGERAERPRRRGRPRRSRENDAAAEAGETAPKPPQGDAASQGEAAKKQQVAPVQDAAAEVSETPAEPPVKRRPGRPRKKKPEEIAGDKSEVEGNDLPDFRLASNG